jgi:hypothetical protein
MGLYPLLDYDLPILLMASALQVDAGNPPAVRDWAGVLQQAQLVPGVTGEARSRAEAWQVHAGDNAGL